MPSDESSQDLIRHAHTLETRAAQRTWDDYAVVRVRGDDRVSWLNGQLTNDVRQIDPNGTVHALAVNVRGKILSDLWVTAFGESLLLLVPTRTQDTLLESLERYIIMEDVVLERAPELRVLGLEGPEAPNVVVRLEAAADVTLLQRSCAPLGIGGVIWIGPEAALAAIGAELSERFARIDPQAYELVRLRRKLPRFGVDFDEHHYPQEAGLKALVSFQKGCYLGQEVVCTLENRGRLSRRLCVLQGDSRSVPSPGTALLTSEDSAAEPAGSITSAIWDPANSHLLALGYVRRAHAIAGTSLRAAESTLTLIGPVGDEQ